MPFIADVVYDSGLTTLTTNGDLLHICSSEPATYAAAVTASLGNSAVTTGSPANGAVDGRRVIVGAITGGTVTATGTASHWALTNGTDTLYATGALSATQAVTSGNTFTLDAISITIRDATAEA